MYVGLYHGFFGLLLALVARSRPVKNKTADSKRFAPKRIEFVASTRRALAAAAFLWVAVELARTRITGFPWELLGYAQTGNFALTRIATFTGVYGLSFEIALVNSVFAAAVLAPKERRKWLLAAAFGAALLLQAGQVTAPPAVSADHTAILVQPNIPILDGARWTKEYFENTLRDLTVVSLQAGTGSHKSDRHSDLIVWPESPSPFYTNDSLFRDAVSSLARQSQTWVVAGAIGINPAMHSGGDSSQIFNSAGLVSPAGGWVGRYDKVHLVPFGEYLPFPKLFAFAGGLTKEVGEFQHGTSHAPLSAGGKSLGTFICYESIFPDEVREGPLQGAQVLLNISNDGWYGDSGAWKQHLQQTQMRAIENDRWLLSATNTGMTAAIDPYGRIVAAMPRKVRGALEAPYALRAGTTFYTRHGDWFAFLCAIISAGAVVSRWSLEKTGERLTTNG
jgi:apolipoprotein N-acyltransferase